MQATVLGSLYRVEGVQSVYQASCIIGTDYRVGFRQKKRPSRCYQQRYGQGIDRRGVAGRIFKLSVHLSMPDVYTQVAPLWSPVTKGLFYACKQAGHIICNVGSGHFT